MELSWTLLTRLLTNNQDLYLVWSGLEIMWYAPKSAGWTQNGTHSASNMANVVTNLINRTWNQKSSKTSVDKHEVVSLSDQSASVFSHLAAKGAQRSSHSPAPSSNHHFTKTKPTLKRFPSKIGLIFTSLTILRGFIGKRFNSIVGNPIYPLNTS